MTDDELANAIYMISAPGHIAIQTAAKERIRWLSRRLTEKPRAAVPDGYKLVPTRITGSIMKAIMNAIEDREKFDQQLSHAATVAWDDALAAAPPQPGDAQGGEG